jgi:hypothetical protein
MKGRIIVGRDEIGRITRSTVPGAKFPYTITPTQDYLERITS